MPDDKTIEKIKAILRKAGDGNPSEEERLVALRMAQRLMLKHGIDESELGDLHTDGRDILEEEFFRTSTEQDHWKGSLLCNIAEFYFCEAYAMQPPWAADRWQAKWYLMGRADHVTICKAMFEFIVPQVEAKFNEALVNYGNIQERHARTYAIETCKEMQMDESVVETMTDSNLAMMGKLRLESIELKMDPIEDIMSLCEIESHNYAKKVRAYIRREQIGHAAATSRLDNWRRSFFYGAIAELRERIEDMTREEVEDLGQKGTALVVSEREALEVYKKETDFEVEKRPNEFRADPYGLGAGMRAGAETDLSQGRKITTPRKELNQ